MSISDPRVIIVEWIKNNPDYINSLFFDDSEEYSLDESLLLNLEDWELTFSEDKGFWGGKTQSWSNSVFQDEVGDITFDLDWYTEEYEERFKDILSLSNTIIAPGILFDVRQA